MTRITQGSGGLGRGRRANIVCDMAGRTMTVGVRGEIDHHTAADIRRDIDTLLFERRPARLVLDLSAVGFMDSSGLGLIMGRLSVMRELGGELTVWNPSPETRGILALAGMERLVHIQYPEGSREVEQTAEHGTPAASPRAGRRGAGRTRAADGQRNGSRRQAADRKEKDA